MKNNNYNLNLWIRNSIQWTRSNINKKKYRKWFVINDWDLNRITFIMNKIKWIKIRIILRTVIRWKPFKKVID